MRPSTSKIRFSATLLRPKAPAAVAWTYLKLPEKASGLLTIFLPEQSGASKLTPMEALEALQKHLQIDADKAAKWMATVREGRR